MNSYVGIIDDNKWNDDSSNVVFTQSCNNAIHKMLPNEYLIFDYMQTKHNGVYTIGRAATITSN